MGEKIAGRLITIASHLLMKSLLDTHILPAAKIAATPFFLQYVDMPRPSEEISCMTVTKRWAPVHGRDQF